MSPSWSAGNRAPRPELSLRPIADGDLPFLRELYASTRAEELARVPWSAEQKTAFLNQQFDCQHRAYGDTFPDASRDLILEGVQPVGRLYVHRGPADCRIVDISLLPTARNRGIGTHYLLAIMEESAARHAIVSLHVEQTNPAARLYQRLGFQIVASQDLYLRLQWRPAAGNDASRLRL